MSLGDESRSRSRLRVGNRTLWYVALLSFGVGDTVTTGIGLTVAGLAEAGPIGARLVPTYGTGVILPLKLLALAGIYALWRATPAPYRVAVPTGVALVGLGLTAWNLYVLVRAT